MARCGGTSGPRASRAPGSSHNTKTTSWLDPRLAKKAKPPEECKENEPSCGGHGTQVNVTCIVNVCSSSGSDHGPQCSSQASHTTGDVDASPSSSPDDQQVPFSQEECPFQFQPGALETLLENPEDKPLPLGVPDAGMKSS